MMQIYVKMAYSEFKMNPAGKKVSTIVAARILFTEFLHHLGQKYV